MEAYFYAEDDVYPRGRRKKFKMECDNQGVTHPKEVAGATLKVATMASDDP